MSSDKLDFEDLIAPVAPAEFFARYWERAPLLIARREPERYGALLPLDAFDALVAGACRREDSSVELLGDARIVGTSYAVGATSPEAVREAFARGATVRVNNVQQLSPQVGALCRRLEQFFSFPLRANLYRTPATAQGAARHYDNHDILVLQLAGRKRWLVYAPLVALPLEHVPPLSFERRAEELKYLRGGPQKGRADIAAADAGAPLADITLEAGDLLYLPRGFVHEATTCDEASLHLTLGIHVLTWLDLLAVALGQTANRDERLRRALPPGFALESGDANEFKQHFDALLQSFTQHADLKRALDETAASFVRSREATRDDAEAATGKAATGEHAMDVAEAESDRAARGGAESDGAESDGAASDEAAIEDAVRSINLETQLERAGGLLCRLVLEGGMVGLASARGVLWMPANFADALRFVARAVEFRVREVPGLSDGGRVALARRLVRDGVLRGKRQRLEVRG